MDILKPIIAAILTPIFSLASWAGVLPEQQVPDIQPIVEQQVEARLGAYNITGGGTYRLKASIGSSNTTINLSSFKESVSNIPLTMSYLNTSIVYATIDPNTTRSEFVSFTGITQNSDGSAQLTGVTRGLTKTPRGSACTASTTLAMSHPGQSVLVISDSPCHFANYAVKSNDETITGQWTFSTFPVTPSNSSASETVAGVAEIGTRNEVASSTSSGGVGRLVIGANVATDTPNVTATSTVVVTDMLGKIKSGFLDLATYNATSSLATTTIGFFTKLNLFGTTTATTTVETSTETDMFNYTIPQLTLYNGVVRTKTFVSENTDDGGASTCGPVYARLYLDSTIIASTTIPNGKRGPMIYQSELVGIGSSLIRGHIIVSTSTQNAAGTGYEGQSAFRIPTQIYAAQNASSTQNLRLTFARSITSGSCTYRAGYSYGEYLK